MLYNRRSFLRSTALAGGAALAGFRVAADDVSGASGECPTSSATRKGVALTVGLNRVSPDHYAGWSGPLQACENDARDMAALASGRGFEVRTLLSDRATRDAFVAEIDRAAQQLRGGDFFFLHYSGHGGRLPDMNGDEGIYHKDATLCLFDGQLVDDEMYDLLARFGEGVRVLVFSDSCHSETQYRFVFQAGEPPPMPPEIRRVVDEAGGRVRSVLGQPNGRALAEAIYDRNKEFYDRILTDRSTGDIRTDTRASILFFSACAELETALDGEENGVFTGILKYALARPEFLHNYVDLTEGVKRLHLDAAGRNSRLSIIGRQLPGVQFQFEEPFTI